MVGYHPHRSFSFSYSGHAAAEIVEGITWWLLGLSVAPPCTCSVCPRDLQEPSANSSAVLERQLPLLSVSTTTMGKDTPRREANRVGRGGNGMKKKAIANLTTKKKTITKAPREIRDIRIKKKGDASSMDVADGSASAGGKKSKPGKNLRKAQRKLSGSKKATRAKKEKRKHIN